MSTAEKLAEALEALIEDVVHEDHHPHDWSEQVCILKAREALAAIRSAPAVERGVTLEQVEDALADACLAAEIPDSKFESLSIAMRDALKKLLDK